MRTIPAFQGEFGLKVRYWIPQVHTLCLREPCRVEIEEGEEALYPAAAERVIVARPHDDTRHKRPPDLGVPETRFVPEPVVCHGIRPDIVVCPRRRTYGSGKNWDGWPRLVGALDGVHVVFAAGAPDSSYEVQCGRAWDEPRFLDASIEAMRNARLVIATDAGLAHLAVLCGAPLLLLTYRGLVAPGPVIDSRGRKAKDQYWPVRLEEYYGKANHTGAPIRVIDGWENPRAVADEAARIVGAVV